MNSCQTTGLKVYQPLLYLPKNFGPHGPSSVIELRAVNLEVVNSSWLSSKPDPISEVAAFRPQYTPFFHLPRLRLRLSLDVRSETKVEVVTFLYCFYSLLQRINYSTEMKTK